MCLFSWWIDCGVNESVPLLSRIQTELVMIMQRWLSSRSCPSQTICALSFIFCSAHCRWSVALTPVTLMTRLRGGERRRVAWGPDRESTEPEEQSVVRLMVWLFSSEPFKLFKNSHDWLCSTATHQSSLWCVCLWTWFRSNQRIHLDETVSQQGQKFKKVNI